MPESPVFETRDVGGRPLVVCTYGGETGTARIFSAGEQEAKNRAEKQARDKYAKRPPE